MKKNKTWLTALVAVTAGILLGWIFFHQDSGSKINPKSETENTLKADTAEVYTCAMHPQIRQPKPGYCPICGMELIPVEQGDLSVSNKMVEMSEEAIQLANVQTTMVESAQASESKIILTGKIMVDQRNLYSPTAQFDGRIEKLYVNYTGQYVSKGEVLASVYSPDLISAEQELLVALPYKGSNPEMYNSARNKLKYWQISERTIDKIEKKGKILESIPIQAQNSGVVMKLNVSVGDRVKTGDVFYEIANLSKLWVMMDAYEQNLGAIHKGDVIQFTVPSIHDKVYTAKVAFIDPFIDPQTRIAKVRAEINNPDGELKPEMFVKGTVNTQLKTSKGLLIPQSAVLWTGKRSLVYVKIPNTKLPTFEYREVTLGPESGNNYIITKGLNQGEEIVTNGTFTIDAAAQLAGKSSMMAPEGGVSGGSMPGMDMGGDKTKVDSKKKMNTDHTDMNNRLHVSKDFKAQLEKVFNQYVTLRETFTNGDANGAQKSAKDLLKAMANVNMKLLENKEAHNHWMTISKEILSSATAISQTSDLEKQRLHFKHLSAHFSKAVTLFGVNKKVYEIYCPMADNNKGAFWLSLDESIKNPYLGSKMSSCGDVKTIIEK